jgi:hypothetical protein
MLYESGSMPSTSAYAASLLGVRGSEAGYGYESGNQIPEGAELVGLMAQLEAAGCVSAANPLECFKDAVAAGTVKDPAVVANQISNITRACKNGGIGSCTDLLRRNDELGLGCQKAVIESWHPNVTCDCDTRLCTEKQALSNQERDAAQLGVMPGRQVTPAMIGIGLAAVGGLAYFLMRR